MSDDIFSQKRVSRPIIKEFQFSDDSYRFNDFEKVLISNFKRHDQSKYDSYFLKSGTFKIPVIKELFFRGYKVNDNNFRLFDSNLEVLVLDYKYNKNNKYINLFKDRFSNNDIRLLFSYGYVLTDDSPRSLLDNELAIVLDYKNSKSEHYLGEFLLKNHFSDKFIDMLFDVGFRLRKNGLLSTNVLAIAKNYELYHDENFVIDFLKRIRLNNYFGREEKIADIIFKFIDVGFNDFDSIPDEIFKVKSIVLSLYKKTLNDSIIDKYKYHLSDSDILEIINLGYKVSKKSNSYILSNKNVFYNLVLKCNPNIINLYIGSDLDSEILKVAFKKGYNIKNCSIDFLVRNSLIVSFAFKYNQVDELSSIIENNFSEELIISLNNKFRDFLDVLNISDLKKHILVCYNNISNNDVKNKFLSRIFSIGIDNLDCSLVTQMVDLIERIDNTNSLELKRISNEVIDNLLNCDNPSVYLNRIEKIFLKNDLPYFEKVYMVFQTLFPNVSIRNNSSVLNIVRTDYVKNMIIEIDLLKCFIGSNNKNLRDYINMIVRGNSIYQDLYCKLSGLSIDLQKEYIYQYLYDIQDNNYLSFVNFISCLKTITSEVNGKFNTSNSFVDDIFYLFHEYSDKDLSKYIFDKIFSRALGVDVFNFSDVIDIMNTIRDETDLKNREFVSKGDFSVKKGDLVKGLDFGGINYLSDILGNGSLCKEMLGSNSDSDVTPLDTDVSFFKKDYDDIGSAIDDSFSRNYGPIWFVIKNDDRFMTTKIPSFLPWYKIDDNVLRKNKFSKYELFSNGTDAGGIRTGFPSSMIDFIVVESYDDRIGLCIAMNGFYIPVVDKSGKVLFSPSDYDFLRSKMDGLSYYGFNDYKFSDNLYFDGLSNVDSNDFSIVENRIRHIIGDSIKSFDLVLKDRFDGDLSSGSVFLFNTGSTGRGTGVGDADFDFVMSVDSSIIRDDYKFSLLRDSIMEFLGGSGLVFSGNIRDYSCDLEIDGVVRSLKIDISFVTKTDKIDYSTDQCVRDRLSTIKSVDSEKYQLVLSNIIYAKEFMKSICAYKPDRKDSSEGGMGGVGIENWILQNGGSFIDAAKSFLSVACSVSSFDEFKSLYHVYDFGCNYMGISKNEFLHDDFICNMNDDGFLKIKNGLSNFIKDVDDEFFLKKI